MKAQYLFCWLFIF